MMSTVMHHCGGVITEPRFKEMTDAQWVFHYTSIRKEEEAKKKYQVTIVTEALKIMSEVIGDRSEMISFFANPQGFVKYQESKDKLAKSDEELADEMPAELDLLAEYEKSFDEDPDEIDSGLVDVGLAEPLIKTIPRRMLGINKGGD